MCHESSVCHQYHATNHSLCLSYYDYFSFWVYFIVFFLLRITLFTDGGRVALATTHWKLIIFRNKISLTIPNIISTPPGNRAHRHDDTFTTYKMRFIVCVAKNLKVNYHCKTPRMHNFKFVYVCEIYIVQFYWNGLFVTTHSTLCRRMLHPEFIQTIAENEDREENSGRFIMNVKTGVDRNWLCKNILLFKKLSIQ